MGRHFALRRAPSGDVEAFGVIHAHGVGMRVLRCKLWHSLLAKYSNDGSNGPCKFIILALLDWHLETVLKGGKDVGALKPRGVVQLEKKVGAYKGIVTSKRVALAYCLLLPVHNHIVLT